MIKKADQERTTYKQYFTVPVLRCHPAGVPGVATGSSNLLNIIYIVYIQNLLEWEKG